MSPTLILILVIVVFVFVAISIYNSLVSLSNRYKNAYAQIDVQLKRRYDLIPSLVETAKGYIKHERETLTEVVAARNQASQALQNVSAKPAGDPEAMKSLIGAESVLSGAMGRLMAVVERYPDLKANQTMSQLMEELTSTENKISFARQSYNDSVMAYNIKRESFPANVIANMSGFKEAVLFEIQNAVEREAVKVSF